MDCLEGFVKKHTHETDLVLVVVVIIIIVMMINRSYVGEAAAGQETN